MTRALPRAHFNSSRLVRFLTENAMADSAPAGDDVGQKLGDWLNFRHAIALHAALNPDPQPAARPVHANRANRVSAESLTRHVDKVRAQLEQSILQGAPPGSGLARIDMPPPELDEPLEIKTAFEPYRRFYAAHQRQMESAVQKLRSQVRGQLSQSDGALQQLASLDTAFESMLNEREAALLAKVPKLLEKRFVQALKQHLKPSTDPLADRSEDASSAQKSVAAWLMPLRQMVRTALLAELDTRLQPTLGLLEAFNPETPQEP